MTDHKIIEVENIVKRYDHQVILKQISFYLRKGEVLLLCGPSGCGKSTLLRCINGLEPIDAGTIWFNGRCVNEAKPKELMEIRLNIGLVFQRFNLFPHMTAIDNITLAQIKILKRSLKEAKKIAMELLDMVGIPEKAHVYPCALSGGQSQRVAIARALAMNPELMLFDEPTSALDPEMKEEVLNVIRKVHREKHVSMIVVTHEIAFGKNVANRAMMIEGGEIVEEKDAVSFFDSPQQERTKKFIRSIINK
jgi:ABC-type polar amino acid transport system ATPase subunit